MKIVEQYICEICGTQYTDKARAEKLPISSDASGLPAAITIEYKDGKYTKTAVYKR